MRGTGIALRTQGDTQVIVRLFEIRLQLDRPPEGRDRAGCVAIGFEFFAEVTLCLRIIGIDFDGFAELGEGASVIALAAQRHAQQRVRPCVPGIQAKGATKLSRRARQIAELAFGQSQLQMHFGGGLRL